MQKEEKEKKNRKRYYNRERDYRLWTIYFSDKPRGEPNLAPFLLASRRCREKARESKYVTER